MKIKKKTTILILAAVLFAGSATAAAWAAPVTDNMVPIGPNPPYCTGDPDGGDGRVTCQTDNAAVTYYMDSADEFELEAVDKGFVRETMAKDYAPTDLTVTLDSTPTFSGSAETDIVYQEGSKNLDADSDGVTWCNDAVAFSLKCDQNYVRIRGNGEYRRGIACHETGHAVGLRHGSGANPQLNNKDERLGCMVTPTGWTVSLGSNNIQHINIVY